MEAFPYSAIWQILVDECGVRDRSDDYLQFKHHWPKCREFRLNGKLGFGGKVWASGDNWYVTCYREHETPERLAMMARANERLGRLYDQHHRNAA